ncbi:hemerythrin domain-containing protein [Nonomuraea terrae]|uniref:hemerythrin domain-containing protein n=1 Tax=Nonomuraea terrae TaxID=2530383 RepID=UPI0037AB3C21
MSNARTEPMSIIETRLTHDFHREATSLLADAARRPGVPLPAVAVLRDFLVAQLHHHHESEDDLLWPRLAAADAQVAAGLAGLSEEHEQLDASLDALAAAPAQDDGDRAKLAEAASAVRDLVHRHLEHEEPLLFAALRAHMPAEDWAEFSRQVIATSPMDAAHLLIGFFDLVGDPREVELVLAGLPEPARAAVPLMRAQAETDLRVLRAAS